MKHNKFTQHGNPKSANASLSIAGSASDETEISCPSSADELARRAYFSYLNQGSLPGHEVQHWLEAEAEMLAERNLTRVHGFHNHA